MLLGQCAAHREYFDFSSGTTNQPIMNYLVLKAVSSRLNVVKANTHLSGHLSGGKLGSRGGSPHFERRGNALFDGDHPLRYLHWAGAPMRIGGPYRDLWEHYRYRNAPPSKAAALMAQAHKQIQAQTQAFDLQRLKSQLKKASRNTVQRPS